MNIGNMINTFLNNFQNPQGFWGKMVLWAMNKGHSSLSRWGMSHIKWQQDWEVLDIGCGGGANLAQILRRCSTGKVYGIDISQASVDFAKKKNRKDLLTRCFIEQGTVNALPHIENKFNVVTAFETIYFWNHLQQSFREVARVLKKEGYFLICCEMNDPQSKAWVNRIEGMTIYSGEELKKILSESGFDSITIHKHEKAICIIARTQF